VLRYYSVHRALVRAKVAALRMAQLPAGSAEARTAAQSLQHYLQWAVRCSAPAHPALMLTHGFSGSGKTLLTQSLLEATGAVRFRADVERKRLAGLQPLQRARGAVRARLYSPQMDIATHARLRTLATQALRGGYSVILDATFLRHRPRHAARRLAERLGVGFVLIDFQASRSCLERRVASRARRGDDASDAGLGVLRAQWAQADALRADERALGVVVDAEQTFDEAAMPARWAPLLRRLRRIR
jgi:predicted kinase